MITGAFYKASIIETSTNFKDQDIGEYG